MDRGSMNRLLSRLRTKTRTDGATSRACGQTLPLIGYCTAPKHHAIFVLMIRTLTHAKGFDAQCAPTRRFPPAQRLGNTCGRMDSREFSPSSDGAWDHSVRVWNKENIEQLPCQSRRYGLCQKYRSRLQANQRMRKYI